MHNSNELEEECDYYGPLSAKACSLFNHEANNVMTQLNISDRLINNTKDYFANKSFEIPARGARGRQIMLDLQAVKNSEAYGYKPRPWIQMLKESAGSGPYKPPRSINPKTKLWFRWLEGSKIDYDRFVLLTKAVWAAGQKLEPKILT